VRVLLSEPGAARVQANYVAIDETTAAELPRRLVQTVEHTQDFAEALSRHFPPIAMCVVQPVGRFPAPTLTAAWAATLIALKQALPDRLLIYSQTTENWMDELSVRGGQSGTGKARLMELARTLGYDGDDQDGADAVRVGETLRRRLSVAQDTAAAA
jgi:hypothetical protein